jgi:heterodisulfide reductase subunit C
MKSNHGSDDDTMKEMEREILANIQLCINCRMCLNMCPTYEGWFTQGSFGRLAAINAYFKYGLGEEERLSELLYSCATCRRCQERCKMLCTNASPSETILKARNLLVKKAQAAERKGS